MRTPLYAAMAALALSLFCSSAASPQTESAPPPRPWAKMLAALELSGFPPGARAYRRSWDAAMTTSAGYIEILILPGGEAWMVTSWTDDKPPQRLQPGDTEGFETEMRKANVSELTGEGGCSCVDDCAEQYLWVLLDGRSRDFHVCDKLVDAINEMGEIADARTGVANATPAPWWSKTAAQPAPWSSEEPVLRPLEADYDDRGYRLVILPAGGPPRVITIALTHDRGLDPPCVFAAFCGYDIPNAATVSGSRLPLSYRPAFTRVEALEKALTAAGFATLPAAPGPVVPCATGTRWALEAVIKGRHRLVWGDTCSRHDLDPVLTLIARLGHDRRWLAAP